ncbi:acyl-CoA dehydrogenase family protein [Phaeacidiphilus oryzae]|uniref:acyl-CoA dehydrogenase family protein n=1 Tax=Phaeacidiphilus oryzae TaxID=348818 RepID=UPI000A0251A6|nr:acyl-CoA dehydrogenase family protein [Phaeacidiphilus oryzae]
MDFSFGPEIAEFRAEARQWLAERLGPGGAFAALLSPEPDPALRREWERELGRGRWIGLGWPQVRPDLAAELESYGVRSHAGLAHQVVWAEEYARAGAPSSLLLLGEHLLGPTLVACGSPAQRARFLPPIARGEEVWCQGYSEPGAGSDLASVRARAERAPDGDGWLVTGQKIWTSLAQYAGWCFALCRTEPGSERHRGLSLLLLPMDQPGRIEVRPIRQLTGDGEFNEVFFDGARAVEVVGEEGAGWKVAMTLLSFERGAGMLARQIGYERELDRIVQEARQNGAAKDPVLRERIVRQWADLRVLRCNALATLGGSDPAAAAGAASAAKLLWAGWHQRLGELALAVRGPSGALRPAAPGAAHLDEAQYLALFSRADTIYGGSDQIQRDVLATRVLGLPRA